MNLYARQRQDLLDEELKIPAMGGLKPYITLSDWQLCQQPDSHDNEEFNVWLPHMGLWLNSIDLEFKTMKGSK